jgi:hypothetical protein
MPGFVFTISIVAIVTLIIEYVIKFIRVIKMSGKDKYKNKLIKLAVKDLKRSLIKIIESVVNNSATGQEINRISNFQSELSRIIELYRADPDRGKE